MIVMIYYFTFKNNDTQPIIKNTPPIGVIIPNDFIPVTAKTYKLPEKKIIPKINAQPARDNCNSGWIFSINPNIKIAIV